MIERLVGPERLLLLRRIFFYFFQSRVGITTVVVLAGMILQNHHQDYPARNICDNFYLNISHSILINRLLYRLLICNMFITYDVSYMYDILHKKLCNHPITIKNKT